MAIALVLEWEGVGESKYEQVMEKLNMELGKNPGYDGGITHMAGPTDNGWFVVDVWESQAHFDKFLANHLGPASEELGVPQPSVRVVPLFNHFSIAGS